MSKIRVEVSLVDGGLQEFAGAPDIMHRLRALEGQGLEGKQLINELITDDWGPPPSTVRLRGVDDTGAIIDRSIPYR